MKALETISEAAQGIFIAEKESLAKLNPTYDELLEWAAVFRTQAKFLQAALHEEIALHTNTSLNTINDPQEKILITSKVLAMLQEEVTKSASDINNLHAKKRRTISQNALKERHKKTRAKHKATRKAWASGIYRNRNECAEKECEKLKMTFEAARKALYKTPTPLAHAKQKTSKPL